MRIPAVILMFVLATVLGLAQAPPAISPCSSNAHSDTCKNEKRAHEAFTQAVKLEKANRDEEAFDALERAVRLAPANVEYLTTHEIVRQQLVSSHIRRGNDLLSSNHRVEAGAEFQQALALDPTNDFARQLLQDVFGGQMSRASRVRVEQSSEMELAPRPGTQDFHYRGDARTLLQTITRAFGITAVFDDSFVPRPVRFDIDGADYYTAMRAASRLTKSFATAMSATQALIAANTLENHNRFDRWSLRVFYLPDSGSPQELNELLTVLRTLFDIRYITQQPASSTITAHGPKAVLDAATQFLEEFSGARPQVALDMAVYEINEAGLLTFGLSLPAQFQAINIPAAALAALTQPNIQDLINQLIASGGINQANTQAIAALLAQVQQQQNSLFSGQPVATFGGGSTLFGVPVPPATLTFSMNQSRISNLEHVTLRASQGNPATLRIGSRYPILNATFSPIFNTPQIAQVIANQSFIAPFPSFNYEDLGLTLKATPAVQTESVSLQLELDIRALGAQSFNGIPVIANRSYKTSITLKDGEPAVVAGTLSESEQKSLQGIIGLGQIPALGLFFSTPSRQLTRGEILVVITPHIIRSRPASGPEIWMPSL